MNVTFHEPQARTIPLIRHPVYRLVGLCFWLGVVVAIFLAVRSVNQDSRQSTGGSVFGYLAGPNTSVQTVNPNSQLRVHDPVFSRQPEGGWSQIGFVSAVSSDPAVATVSWHSSNLPPDQCNLILYRNSGRLEDVIGLLMPPEKRLRIQQRLAAAMSEHGDDLSAAFLPLVQQSLQHSLPVIEEEFRFAVERHRDDVDELTRRWNDEVIRSRLIPLAKSEILPIVRKHGEPEAEAIGRELWDRASLWRFGWRAIYDKSPLPRKDLLEEEWDRFVEVEAIPIFESHTEAMVEVVQEIVSDVAANERIRSEIADVADEMAGDPEARRQIQVILRETLIDNQRLQRVWSEVWTSDEAKVAFEMAGDRLEPVVRSIGDELFGTRESGIDPNFARVLRNQILGKDRRWIVAKPTTGQRYATPLPIRFASDSMPYPIVYMAGSSVDGGDRP